MQKKIHSLKQIFQEKIDLCKDLLEYLKKEKSALVDIDIDNIWSISMEKQKILTRLQSLHNDMMAILSKCDSNLDISSLRFEDILSFIPKEDHLLFKRNQLKLKKITKEISLLSEENKFFVQDCLGFINELIDGLSGSEGPGVMYDSGMHIKNNKNRNLLMYREA
ncbi:putative Flagellar protein FlgN [Candidatus Magnetomoraceae bacterium gMMP-1]